jgi:hypothetical protein
MKRCLFFADFLGTTETYSDIERVKRRRELLELSVEAYFVPHLEKEDLYVYIVSDSLFVTCPTVRPLLLPVAKLFKHFLGMKPSKPTEPLKLHMLRGAISYGEEAKTAVIKNSARVTAIPMLDDSLPRATALEKIRNGSRVFLDENVLPALTQDHENCLLRWKNITGKGDPKANVTELLWPCVAYEGQRELLDRAEQLRTEWLTLFRTKEWDADEYGKGLMIQLDETLKLFIRSLARSDGEEGTKEYLMSILPQTVEEKIDVKFEWGMWFQALKALSEWKKGADSIDFQVKKRLALVKEILSQESFWEHFLTELEKPDYAAFKERVATFL